MKDKGKTTQKKGSIPKGAPQAKRAEEALRESEEKFRALVETSYDWIWAVDKNGVYTYASPRVKDILGYSPEDVVGRTPFDFMPPKERERVLGEFRMIVAKRGPLVALENINRHKDGREVVLETSGMPIFDLAGSFKGYRGIDRDITARKQSESALKQSEAKYRRLYNETPVLLQSIDRNGNLVEVNDYWLKTMGYERNEVIGRKVSDFFTEASRKYAQEVVQPAFFRDGIAKNVSYQFVRKNGEVLDVLLSATAERDAAGTAVRSLAVIQDITERKRAEEKLVHAKNLMQYIISHAQSAIAVHDRDLKYIFVSDQYLHQYKVKEHDVIGKRHYDVFPDLPQKWRDVHRRVLAGAVESQEEDPYVREDGSVDWTRWECRPWYESDGSIGGLIVYTEVITNRKRREEALRASEERFRAITMTASDAILLMDDGGKLIHWNPAAERMFGYSAEEALGKDLHLFLAPQRLHKNYLEGFETFVKTGQGPVINKSVELAAHRKDGTEFPIEVSTSAMSIGGRWHALGIVRDITERKRLEQELIKSEKLKSIGTLAGGIAHDFNNLLQGIFGYISMAKLTHDQKEKSLALLEQAEKALHQSVNLTSQLLTFSKGGKPVKKVFALRPLIEESAAFALSGSRNTYEIVVDKDLRTVEADEGQIGQVIQNIVLNADQAMPLGGMITITARNVPASAAACLPGATGDVVKITIQDRGTGIPEAYLSRIFDPYFTTKDKGSGLGLATTYSIIKNHGGVITVASELGKGTTFTIYLPASGASVEREETSTRLAAGNKGRILVMDDEQVVREVTGELLRSLGHEVDLADRGEAAVMKYKTAMVEGRPFDIVILDLTVRGGMGGAEAVKKLLELDPNVKAVVSSGYSDDAVTADYRKQGFMAFLKKPYNVEYLQSTLNALLA